MDLAPICLFTYNRLAETQQTVSALQKNHLAGQSTLYIFSDGWKNEEAKEKVVEVRDFLKTITGFKEIIIIEGEANKGLAKSIITGVSKIIEKHGKVIVVEDDLILTESFLDFMNQSLSKYASETKVFSVSGFCLKMDPPKNYNADMFFWGRAHSWGWGTWADRWVTVDWDIKDWESFKNNPDEIKKFTSYGTDLFKMLRNSMEGRISSWFIRFTYNQFKQGKLTVYPCLSKVINIGFVEDATNCRSYNRNVVNFDKSGKREFIFSDDLRILPPIRKQMFHYKSYSYRIVGKLLTYLMRYGIIKQNTQKI